jgi:chemotaxis protein methyltransferase CheR
MPDIAYDRALAQAIVDTIREPLLVLDQNLRVVAASRSFYQTFKVDRGDTEGRLLQTLGDGQWDIPELQALLINISPDETVMNAHQIAASFPDIGLRVMLLNARRVFYEDTGHSTILLAMEDITERRAAEIERDSLARDKDLMMQEMQHRVANSLQIIASLLLMKARSVTSEETRGHLQDAHKRILAVAEVQRHLNASLGTEAVELRPYLTQLCEGLAASMIGGSRLVSMRLRFEDGHASPGDAVSIGLIVTELVINALKYAFPDEKVAGVISVEYVSNASGWRLTVSDDGVGRPVEGPLQGRQGLGTTIVAALAGQLHGRLESKSSSAGMSVAITRAVFQASDETPQPRLIAATAAAT